MKKNMMFRRQQHCHMLRFAILLGTGIVMASPFDLVVDGNGETTVETQTISSDFVSNIVNGDQAEPGNFPYFVSMGTCGGTLIAPDVVLTAGHCGDRHDEELLIGAYRKYRLDGGAQSRFCDRWIEHPNFDESDIEAGYDFALCLLDRPVEIDSNVRLELNDNSLFPSEGETLTVMGLGQLVFTTSPLPEYLQFVEEPYLTNNQCLDVYDEVDVGAIVVDRNMCIGDPAGGKGSCRGDSGGPAISRTVQTDGTIVDTQVGVVSFVYTERNNEQCAAPNRPVIYSRVSSELYWIQKTACLDFGSIASFCSPNDLDSPQDPQSCFEQGKHELVVEITTSSTQRRHVATWELSDPNSSVTLMKRDYLIKNFKNTHVICLDRNKSYKWELVGLDGRGRYALTLNSSKSLSGPGRGTYGKVRVDVDIADDAPPIRSQSPSSSPSVSLSESPTESPSGSPVEPLSESPSGSPVEPLSESPSGSPITRVTGGGGGKRGKKSKKTKKRRNMRLRMQM